jgi:alpha-amylase/alpha-mannosidase (GH57 family)
MTRVAILWHMHQPFYQDLVTGEHILPWVRLHALKDYWGMVALLREFPEVRVTFNLVPSMLVQLEAFARDEARDRHLELGLKPADRLSDEERVFCVEHFFHAHAPRMIEPYPRYRELAEKRGSENGGLSARAHASQFSADDIRDLQVWHKLVWLDQEYLDRDERVRRLVARDRGFSEDDKQELRAVELELLNRVIPEYADAAARGQVELSTSPFYHPILPLLCDTDVFLRTNPQSRMPREPFRHPGDAAEQLARAVGYHERLFGKRPDGVWPSEGSVSDAMVPLVAGAGLRWMASDEEILARTLGRGLSRGADGELHQPELLYRAYRVGSSGATVSCGFRDHALSDLIGFTYASWSAERAASDFIHRLAAAGRRYSAQSGGGEATVFVILDGENAWEYYDNQGRPFLRALYGGLSAHPELRTVTMSEACEGPTEALSSIFPGSWINGDFYIWIGHPDDHRAWSQLAEARRALESAGTHVAPEGLARAREEMLIAEGSDWFWWYGDDHSSAHDLAFDDLFRRHVRNVYRALERPIPEELFVSNITTALPAVDIEEPTGFIHPEIDGAISSYFEWVGAGGVGASAAAGTMHQVAERRDSIAAVEFGFDLEHLYVRIDGTVAVRELLARGADLSLGFLKPAGVRVEVRNERGGLRTRVMERTPGGDWAPRAIDGILVAADEVAELRIPFARLGVSAREALAFVVTVNREGVEVEQHPRHRAVELTVPDASFLGVNWTA